MNDPAPPLARAALATLSRDALWRNPPPLAAGCDHDLEQLPVIEFRQTFICRKCGGLDAEASRRWFTAAAPARSPSPTP